MAACGSTPKLGGAPLAARPGSANFGIFTLTMLRR
jgi:hypothetical protein